MQPTHKELVIHRLSQMGQRQREYFEYRYVRGYPKLSGVDVRGDNGVTPQEVAEGFQRLLENKHIVEVLYQSLLQKGKL